MYGNVYYNQRTSTIYWSEYDKENKRTEKNKKWVPDFFVETKEESKYKSQANSPLKRVIEETFAKRKKKINNFKDCGAVIYGSDLAPEVKFILETWQDIKGSPNIHTAFLDIETEAEEGFPLVKLAREKINVITIYSTITNKYYTWALEANYTKNDFKPTLKNVEFVMCGSEEELLKKFLTHWKNYRYDIVSGWNSSGFDIPYIFNRILRILDGIDVEKMNELIYAIGAIEGTSARKKELAKELVEINKKMNWVKKLSPYDVVKKRVKKVKDKFTKEMKSTMVYDIEGITDYDYLKLDEQFRRSKRDSYKLDNVAYDELGERKFDHEGSWKEFYTKDWPRFVNYNIQDVGLLLRLDAKLGYIAQGISLSYKCHCRFKDNFGTVQKAESAICNFLMRDNIVIDDRPKLDVSKRIPGAFVTQKEDLRRGFCHWIIDLDVASLYPSIMRGLNISYDTKIAVIRAPSHILELGAETPVEWNNIQMTAKEAQDKIRENKYQVSSNNVVLESIEKKKGVLIKMLDMWYAQRKQDKKLQAEYRQKALDLFDSVQEETPCGHKVEEKEITKLFSDKEKKQYDEYMRLTGIHFNLQWSCKILLNSIYGCLASGFFRYHDSDLASAVTLSGQTIIKNNGTVLNDYFNGEIFDHNMIKKHFTINEKIGDPNVLQYQDTDSCYLTFDKMMDKLNVPHDDSRRLKVTRFLAKMATNKLEIFSENFFPLRFNAKNTIFWDQELIARTGIWCQPKKYVCYILEENGKPPTDHMLKKGLDIVRSSIPRKFKKYITDAVDMMLKGTPKEELNKFIINVYKDFKKWEITDIAIPSSCNNLAKYEQCKGLNFISETPQHMKAAVTYNFFLKQKKLTQYAPLRERDKFSLLFILKNPIYPIDTFGYKDKIPSEFDIIKLVDKDKHFDRGFIKPLSQIFDAVNWPFPETKYATEDVNDLFE